MILGRKLVPSFLLPMLQENGANILMVLDFGWLLIYMTVGFSLFTGLFQPAKIDFKINFSPTNSQF